MATIREFFGLLSTYIYIKIEDHYFDFTKCPNHSRSFLQKYHLKDATEQFNAIRSHGGLNLQKYEIHGHALEKVRCMFAAAEGKN